MTQTDIITKVANIHNFIVIPDTIAGRNVKMDEYVNYIDDDDVALHIDVLRQGSFSIHEIGSYSLRQQVDLAFMSKVKLDEEGNSRLNLIDRLLNRTFNYCINLLNEFEEAGITTYASPTYQCFTNRLDANMNMVVVTLYLELPAQNCNEYED